MPAPYPKFSFSTNTSTNCKSSGTLRKDCNEKFAQYVDSMVKVRETFDFVQPVEVIRATNVYCSSHYFSELWDYSTDETKKYFNAWKTSMKLIWKVPRNCKTYLLQTVLAPGQFSARSTILSRFHGFFLSLLNSPCHEVQVVARMSARDMRCTLKRNLQLLEDETGLNPWTAGSHEIKLALHHQELAPVPDSDNWRITYLQKLLYSRLHAIFENDQSCEERLTSLINSLVGD